MDLNESIKYFLEKQVELETRIEFLEDFVLAPQLAAESRKIARKKAKDLNIEVKGADNEGKVN